MVAAVGNLSQCSRGVVQSLLGYRAGGDARTVHAQAVALFSQARQVFVAERLYPSGGCFMRTQRQQNAAFARLACGHLELNTAALLQQRREIGHEPRVTASDQPDALAFLEIKCLSVRDHGLGLRQEPGVGSGEHPRNIGGVGFEERHSRQSAAKTQRNKKGRQEN